MTARTPVPTAYGVPRPGRQGVSPPWTEHPGDSQRLFTHHSSIPQPVRGPCGRELGCRPRDPGERKRRDLARAAQAAPAPRLPRRPRVRRRLRRPAAGRRRRPDDLRAARLPRTSSTAIWASSPTAGSTSPRASRRTSAIFNSVGPLADAVPGLAIWLGHFADVDPLLSAAPLHGAVRALLLRCSAYWRATLSGHAPPGSSRQRCSSPSRSSSSWPRTARARRPRCSSSCWPR